MADRPHTPGNLWRLAKSDTTKGMGFREITPERAMADLVRPAKVGAIETLVPICGEFLAVATHPAINFTVDDGDRWDNSFNSDPPDTGSISYDSEIFNGELYRCGRITLNGVGLVKLFKWDAGAGKYVQVSGHGFEDIYTLLVFNGVLYAGGTRTGGVGENVRKFDGSSWTDATGGTCLNISVRRLYNWNGTLIACGESGLGDGFHGVAYLSGSWQPMGTGLALAGGTNPGTAWDCANFDTGLGDVLVIVGRFNEADGNPALNTAQWDGGALTAFNDIGDSSVTLYAVREFKERVYTGGSEGVLYRSDGGAFEVVGEILVTFLIANGAEIRALEVSLDGEALLVGGLFHKRESTEYAGYVPEMDALKYRDLNADGDVALWQANQSYGLSDLVRSSTTEDVYFRVTRPGLSGPVEPVWDTTVGDTTVDNTVIWTAIEPYQMEHWHGGVGQNQVITAGGSGVSGSCHRIRHHTLPGESAERTCLSGSFARASDLYSPLAARITTGGYIALGGGLRVELAELPVWAPRTDYNKRDRITPTTPNGFSYMPKNIGLEEEFAGTSGDTEPEWSTALGGETPDGGIIWITLAEPSGGSPSAEGRVIVAIPYQGGFIFGGRFTGFMNAPGRGTLPYGYSKNVVQFAAGAFGSIGEIEGEVMGGCLFNGVPVLCGDSKVRKYEPPDAWQENTPYVENDIVVPTIANGYQYRCIVAGTSHVTDEPPWPTAIGSAVLDGASLEWQCEFLGWLDIGTNLGTGEFRTVAQFDGLLFLGGGSMIVSGVSREFATSSGAAGSAGNWTGGNISGVISIRRYLVGAIDDAGDKLYAACFSLAGVDPCVYVRAAAGTFIELGSPGNRLSGECSDISMWVDGDGVISLVACGGLDVDGTPCSVAEHRAGVWSIIADVLDVSGQALALGTWAKDRGAVMLGGDYAIVESQPAVNLSRYRGLAAGWDLLKNDIGGATGGVLKIGSSEQAG